MNNPFFNFVNKLTEFPTNKKNNEIKQQSTEEETNLNNKK